MSAPRISVLMPVRDAAGTLPDALASLGRQTEPDWECVVVDDGSVDASGAIARRAAARDGRFRLLTPGRIGLVAALNLGLESCLGGLVARMDADDLMHRRRLSEQAALLDARPELAGVGCHVRMFPRSALGPGSLAYEGWLNGQRDETTVFRDIFIECPVAHPSLLLRREVLAAARYREGTGWPEDYDLLLRLVTGGAAISVIPQRRLMWREHPRRLSRTSAVYAIERFAACRAAYLASSFLARSEHYALWGYGGTGRLLARELTRHGRRPSCVVELHPGRLGNRILGAEVIPPQALRDRPRDPLVVSVAGDGPRRRIRDFLAAAGYTETVDFVCAA